MIWAILIGGLLLRSFSLNQSLWLDEAINVLATQNFSLIGMITEYAKADFHPPLYFIIIWVWTRLFGIGEIAVRIPSVIFGILTIYLVYLLGKKIHSKNLGLFSAILLAINPLHIYYSQEARMYALAALAVSINIYLWVKLIKEEKVNKFILVLSNLLVFSSDYVLYLIFPAQLIFLLMYKRKLVKIWITSFLIAILLGIWWLPIFLKQLSVGFAASANLPTWKLLVGGFDIKAIPLTFVKFIIGRISLADKFLYTLLLLPVCSLFLFLILRGIKFTRGIERNLLILWISFPIVLGSLISFVVPLYSYFRLIFTLPLFLLLIALGIISFQNRSRYVMLGAVLAIELCCSLIYLFNSSYHREDWKGMTNYLKSVNQNSMVLLESSGTLPPFDYYAKNINAKGALKNFPSKSSNDLIDLSDISKDVFLVNYLVEISDPQRLVSKKLDNLGYKLIETKDFSGVGFVYHYVRE